MDGDRVLAENEDSGIVDRNGTPILGMATVQFESVRYYAIVWVARGDGKIGIEFPEGYGHRGHDLNGLLPRGNSRGCWVSARSLTVMPNPTPVDDNTTGELVDKLKNLPFFAMVNGQFVQARLEPILGAEELLKERDREVANLYKQVSQQLRAQKEEYERKLQHNLLMPEINLSSIRNEIYVYKWQNRLAYCVPIVYSPKRMTDGSTRNFQFPEDTIKELRREIRVQIVVERGKVGRTVLLDKEFNTFHHYHRSGGQDCLGDVERKAVNTIGDALLFRDYYQTMLETINEGSLGTATPEGLPPARSLAKAEWKVASVGWSSVQFGVGTAVEIEGRRIGLRRERVEATITSGGAQSSEIRYTVSGEQRYRVVSNRFLTRTQAPETPPTPIGEGTTTRGNTYTHIDIGTATTTGWRIQ